LRWLTISGAGAVLAIPVALVLAATLVLGAPPPQSTQAAGGPAPAEVADIPADYLALYVAAGEEYGLDWAVLAAIGKIETDHGRSDLPGVKSGVNTYGCCGGPMQFWIAPPHPNTWDRYGVDANHDGRRDPHDPADAIPAAARYLRASGAPADWRRAIFAYNHAGWYVDQVLAQAKRYRHAAASAPTANSPADGPFDGRLRRPVPGVLTSPFGQRWGRLHAGMDLATTTGDPVHAAAAGTVTWAAPRGGYGNYVCLRHSPGLTSCYAHLSRIRVQIGARVAAGAVVGLAGCTGHCLGPHLHFETRRGPLPTSPPIDPAEFLER